MAWTITRQWVNPPQYDEATNDHVGVHRAHVIISGSSDAASDLTEEQVVPISVLRTVRGALASNLSVECLKWDLQNMGGVELFFDRSPVVSLGQMADGGESYFDPPLADIGEAGDGTGDLVVSTFGGANNSRFRIEATFRVA